MSKNTLNNNTYYVVDHSINIVIGKVYNKIIGNFSFLLWRKSKGKLIAQSKFCTHLGASLTKGKIKKDKLFCPFHGFNFDENGKSNMCIPKLKNYTVIEKYGFIWVKLGDKINDTLGNFIPKIDFKEYDIIPCYNKVYNLPTILATSNFFDLNHFKHIHGVEILDSKLLNKTYKLHYLARGLYKPYFYFQKIFLKFFPNIVENEVFYKDNFIFSRHSILNKKGKTIFEYYGFFPSTPIGENNTLIVSSIMVKKGIFSHIAKIYGKKVLFKATNDEFKMLEGGNYNINNFVSGDDLLETFLDFYNNE